MAYNQHFADRIESAFSEEGVEFEARSMMGGRCFMVDGKMCCGLHFDKKKDTDLLMARIGEEASEKALEHPHCYPMDFTGRPMKGFVFLKPEGFDEDEDLKYWLQLCLDFNPKAKRSKKKSAR